RSGGGQVWVAVGISPRHDHLLEVNRILRHKTMSKIVKGMAKLTWTGLLLKLFGIQPKPKISTCHGQGLRIRFSGKLNLTLLPVIGCINPIVHVKSKIGDLGFLIVLKKAGEKNLLFI